MPVWRIPQRRCDGGKAAMLPPGECWTFERRVCVCVFHCVLVHTSSFGVPKDDDDVLLSLDSHRGSRERLRCTSEDEHTASRAS